MSDEKRFFLMSESEALENGLIDYDSGEWRQFLFERKTDGTIEEIACDRGEPEDNTFTRDWRWVVPLLNKLAEEER